MVVLAMYTLNIFHPGMLLVPVDEPLGDADKNTSFVKLVE